MAGGAGGRDARRIAAENSGLQSGSNGGSRLGLRRAGVGRLLNVWAVGFGLCGIVELRALGLLLFGELLLASVLFGALSGLARFVFHFALKLFGNNGQGWNDAVAECDGVGHV